MNHYPHHISDFNNATRHLSLLERAIYRDLLDHYYDTEKPILKSELPKLSRKLMVRSKSEKESLQIILGEFFKLKGDFFHHQRCDEEIKRYQERQKSAGEAGKRSASVRSQRKANGYSTTVEHSLNVSSTERQGSSTNQEPVTSNQEPYSPQPPEGSEEGVTEKAVDSIPIPTPEPDKPAIPTPTREEIAAEERRGFDLMEQEEQFNSWFAAYPRQTDRHEAARQWLAIRGNRPDLETLLSALDEQKSSDQWTRDDGRFVPNPAAYLAGRKWEDKLKASKKPTTSPHDF